MIIYASEQAKANRVDYYRRNTMYLLTCTDLGEHAGKTAVHSAVTARKELGLEKRAFYEIVAGNDPTVRASKILMISDNWELRRTNDEQDR